MLVEQKSTSWMVLVDPDHFDYGINTLDCTRQSGLGGMYTGGTLTEWFNGGRLVAEKHTTDTGDAACYLISWLAAHDFPIN